MSTLSERAILVRLSIGMPGQARQDADMTSEVKRDHALGSQSGKWIKALYPPEALEPIKKLDNEAREYHNKVTLPFDLGIGILPAGLILEHGDKMRNYAAKREQIVESHFLAKYDQWVEWARVQHNGTFDEKQYPGPGALRSKFYFRVEPLPVPDSEHFSGTVATLLGTDTQSVDLRVKDAALEAQRELMRRLLEPVQAMARKLSEPPKEGKDCPIFRDSLIGNIVEIAELAPKLNLSGDAQIDLFTVEAKRLTRLAPDTIRKDSIARVELAREADAIAKKMAAYSL